MAASLAMNSFKTRLFVRAYSDGDPGSPGLLGASGDSNWTRIAEVISISGLPVNSSVTKQTHLESDGKAHEKIPGFLDLGQVTVRLNYSKTLIDQFISRLPSHTGVTPSWQRYWWLIQFPDGGQWRFVAFVQGMPVEVPEDDRITYEVTLEASGRPAFTAAA